MIRCRLNLVPSALGLLIALFLFQPLQHLQAAPNNLTADEITFANNLLHPPQKHPEPVTTLPQDAKKILALLADKTLVMAAVANNGLDVKYAHPSLRDDLEVMMRAIRQNGLALRYASERLKDNRKLVRVAVMQEPMALQFASQKRRDDKTILTIGVQRPSRIYPSVNVLQFASERLKKDRDTILLAVKQRPDTLKIADPRFRDDPAVIRIAGMRYAGEKLANNRQFVLNQINKRPDDCSETLTYIGEQLSQDRDFIVRVLKKPACKHAFNVLPLKFRSDRRLATIAIQQDAVNLALFDESIRSDKALVSAAVKKKPSTLIYASEALRNDKQLVMHAVRKDTSVLSFISPTLRDDRQVILSALQNRFATDVLYYASERLKKDPATVLACVRKFGSSIRYADQSLKNNKRIILAALKQSDYAFRYNYISPKLKKDPDVLRAFARHDPVGHVYLKATSEDKNTVLAAVKQKGKALQFAARRFQKDRQIVTAAIRQNSMAILYAASALRNDKKMQLLALNGEYGSSAIENLMRNKKNRVHRDVLIAMMKKSSYYFNSLELKHRLDKVSVLAAINSKDKTYPLISAIGKQFRHDQTIINALITRALRNSNPDRLMLYLHYLQTPISSRAQLLKIVALNGLALEYGNAQLRRDRGVVARAIRNNGAALAFADRSLRRDKAMLTMAIGQSAEAYDFAAPALMSQANFAMQALKKGHKHVLQRLFEKLDQASANRILDIAHSKRPAKPLMVHKITLETDQIPSFYSDKESINSPIFRFSSDRRKLAGVLQLRPQKLTYLAIWDAANGQLLHHASLPFHYHPILDSAMRFTPDKDPGRR